MKKKILVIALAILLLISAAACGNAKTAYPSENSSDSYYNQSATSVYYEESNNTSQIPNFASERKLVYTANISIETVDFDKTQEEINNAISSCGGYIYSSELYTASEYSQNSSLRNYCLSIKIPSEKYREFLNGKDNFGNVTSFYEQNDDITSQYIDAQARLDALKEQEKRLLELIEKAQNVTELLEIEDKLSDVRYNIENYTSQMQTYDNMVSYCTVNITVIETSEISKVNKGFFSKISEGFVSSWVELLNFMQSVAIWISERIAFLLLLCIVTVLLYKLIKKRKAEQPLKMPNFENTTPSKKLPKEENK